VSAVDAQTFWRRGWALGVLLLGSLSASRGLAVEAPSGRAVTLSIASSSSSSSSSSGPAPTGPTLVEVFRSKIPPGFLPEIAFDGAGDLLVAWPDGALSSVSPAGVVTEWPRGEQSFARGPVALADDLHAVASTKPGIWLRVGRASTAPLVPATLPRALVKANRRASQQTQIAADGAGGAWLAGGAEWAHWVDGRAIADGRLAHDILGIYPLPAPTGGALLLDEEGGVTVVGGAQPKTLRPVPGFTCAFSGDGASLGPRRALLGCTNGNILLLDRAGPTLGRTTLPSAQGSLVSLDGGGAAFVDQTGNLTIVRSDGTVRPPSPEEPPLPAVGPRAVLVPLAQGAVAAVTRAGDVLAVTAEGRLTAQAQGCAGVLAAAYERRSGTLVAACSDGSLLGFSTEAR
jgi:hypothetical protein